MFLLVQAYPWYLTFKFPAQLDSRDSSNQLTAYAPSSISISKLAVQLRQESVTN